MAFIKLGKIVVNTKYIIKMYIDHDYKEFNEAKDTIITHRPYMVVELSDGKATSYRNSATFPSHKPIDICEELCFKAFFEEFPMLNPSNKPIKPF